MSSCATKARGRAGCLSRVPSVHRRQGRSSVTVYEGALWQVAGSAGGTAVKLSRVGARSRFKNLGVQACVQRSAAQDPLPFGWLTDITVGGQSIAAVRWHRRKRRRYGRSADRSHEDASPGLKQTAKAKRPAARVAIDFCRQGRRDAHRLVAQHVTVTGTQKRPRKAPVLITDDGEHLWIDAAEAGHAASGSRSAAR